ncbi:MAG: DUF2391 family protein [Nanoarchaeota archaeon]
MVDTMSAATKKKAKSAKRRTAPDAAKKAPVKKSVPKSKRIASKAPAKRAPAKNAPPSAQKATLPAAPEPIPTTEDISKKIDKLLAKDEEILFEEKKLEREEKRIEELERHGSEEEHKLEKIENQEMQKLRELQKLETSIRREVSPHPLKKITYRDITKGAIGAFVGVFGHYSFYYGLKLSQDITMLRASLIYVLAFIMALGFLYFSGFRRIKEVRRFKYVPIRVFIIYITTFLVIVLVLALFNQISFSMPFQELFRIIAPDMLLGILGASAADMIGGE